MEIERKFLVKDILGIDLSKYSRKQIVQDYLYKDLYTIIRKRKIIKDDNEIYKYTIKTDKNGVTVNEIEKEITKSDYDMLKTIEDYNTINKTRYIIPIENDLEIELDIFHDKFEGIIFAEVEFKDEKQANEFKVPDWFDKEITTEITNADMATMTVDSIFEIISKYN